MYRTDFRTLWEKARVGCSERTSLKQVFYQAWNRSPAQVGCMRQVLGAGALGRARGMGWGGGGRGDWDGEHMQIHGWFISMYGKKTLHYCKIISLQLIKINEKKDKKKELESYQFLCRIFSTVSYSFCQINMIFIKLNNIFYQ